MYTRRTSRARSHASSPVDERKPCAFESSRNALWESTSTWVPFRRIRVVHWSGKPSTSAAPREPATQWSGHSTCECPDT